MKCKPYSEITVEIGTQLKTVKITLNIFAVYYSCQNNCSSFWKNSCLAYFFLPSGIYILVLILKFKNKWTMNLQNIKTFVTLS